MRREGDRALSEGLTHWMQPALVELQSACATYIAALNKLSASMVNKELPPLLTNDRTRLLSQMLELCNQKQILCMTKGAGSGKFAYMRANLQLFPLAELIQNRRAYHQVPFAYPRYTAAPQPIPKINLFLPPPFIKLPALSRGITKINI